MNPPPDDLPVQWKSLVPPTPYVTVSGFAIGADGRFPILYRGPNVRSARCAWSLPSGLHVNGTPAVDHLYQELDEELGLSADPEIRRHRLIGAYENISPKDQFHWVILVFVVRVDDPSKFVNREPDKHPDIKLVSLPELIHDWNPAATESPRYAPWAPGLQEFIFDKRSEILDAIHSLV